MGRISKIQSPYVILSKDDICGTWNPIDNYPIFTKIYPAQVLMAYLESFMKDGIEPLVDPFNLPKTCPNVHGKRKKEFIGEGSSRDQKKKKIAIFQDEDKVPLSERQKEIILKDTSGVVLSSSRAFDISFVKLSSNSTPLNSDSILSQRVLPSPPPSQSTIFEPIPLPLQKSSFINPVTETPIIEMPIIETPIVSAPLLDQQ